MVFIGSPMCKMLSEMQRIRWERKYAAQLKAHGFTWCVTNAGHTWRSDVMSNEREVEVLLHACYGEIPDTIHDNSACGDLIQSNPRTERCAQAEERRGEGGG